MSHKHREPTPRTPAPGTSAGDTIDATTSLSHDFLVGFKRALRESHASRNSLLFLIAVNVYSIGVAVYAQWSFVSVLFVYWCQNLIVGFFVTAKLLAWPNIVFAGETGTVNMPEAAAKRRKVLSFVAMFIALHALMAFFAVQIIDVAALDAPMLRYVIGLFAINHALSFVLNYRQDTAAPTTGGRVILEGIIRLVPLWLLPAVGFLMYLPASAVWALAGGEGNVLSRAWQVVVVLFMVLKTFAEVLAHMVSHSSATSSG